jgi:hypothetical protein
MFCVMGFLTQFVVLFRHATQMLKKFTALLHLIVASIVCIYKPTLDYNTLVSRDLGNACFP